MVSGVMRRPTHNKRENPQRNSILTEKMLFTALDEAKQISGWRVEAVTIDQSLRHLTTTHAPPPSTLSCSPEDIVTQEFPPKELKKLVYCTVTVLVARSKLFLALS
jgi:hypothetical protein